MTPSAVACGDERIRPTSGARLRTPSVLTSHFVGCNQQRFAAPAHYPMDDQFHQSDIAGPVLEVSLSLPAKMFLNALLAFIRPDQLAGCQDVTFHQREEAPLVESGLGIQFLIQSVQAKMVVVCAVSSWR